MTSEQIREQLERILNGPSFRNSPRYSGFLKYCVEQTLIGQSDSLKERSIGVDVFGRSPQYDTGADHVVRSGASEVRKRLAQYYQTPETASEIRIEINAGSYVPQFSSPPERPPPVPALPETTTAVAYWQKWLWAIPALVLVGSLILWRQSLTPTALDLFWKPVLASKTPVTICLGDRSAFNTNPNTEDPTVWEALSFDSNWVTLPAATSLAKVATLLQSKEKQYRLVSVSDAKFSDFQDGASILIGSVSNPWGRRLTETTRFGFELKISEWGRVVDRQNLGQKDWTIYGATLLRNPTRDYAIVTRVVDPKTEQATVAISGITQYGTSAAGEFVSSRIHVQKLQAIAPKGWENMNFQVVLSTEMSDGVTGPPKIVATHFW